MGKFWFLVLVLGTAVGTAHASPQGGYLGVFTGRTTVNSYRDHGSTAFELEDRQPYRRSDGRFEASIALLNEGHLKDERYSKRDGLVFEGWWNFFTADDHRLKLSLGTGPYLFDATERPRGNPSGSYSDLQSLGWLVSIGARYDAFRKMAVVFEAHRVRSTNSTDSDVVLLGLARTF